MTTYDRTKLQCFCCGKTSKQTVLMSTNSFGSRDLDQRETGMARSTIDAWLQECPFCGYVASSIDEGNESSRRFLETAEFQAASSQPTSDPAERRFLVHAAFDAYCGDRRAAFLNTLCAAWVADDRKKKSRAKILRLRAAGHLSGSGIVSIDMRLRLLDVLRRASSWEASEALIAELAAEELEYPFAEIVSFHREKVAAKDSGRYTIEEALADKPEPVAPEDLERIKAIARHVKVVPRSGPDEG